MSRCSRAAIGTVLVALVAVPAADARVAGDPAAQASASKKLRLSSVRSLPASVQAGGRVRVRGRVVNLPKSRKKSARLVFTLRSTPNAKRFVHLRTAKISRPRRGTSRNFSLRIAVPSLARPGAYYLRTCVRRSGSEAKGSCRSRRLRVTDRPGPTPPGPTPPGPPAPPGPPTPSLAHHSLRAPLTGENFYFVMADRFQNGDTANDTGGIAATDPDLPDRDEHGFDPTRKGYFHGGDLKGLLSKINYIEGLGTTAIWLTPSFKNRAVQGPEGSRSAGYHGYWVTDFTQIDPHFGTNEDLGNLVEAAHAKGIKVFFDIITNHTADVISYEEATPYTYVSKDRDPFKTAAGTSFDDRDYAGTSTFPALDREASFPYTPENTTGIDKVPGWLNDETLYHNRGDTTFTGEDSQYGDFFGLDDLFTENPKVVTGMEDIYETWIRDVRIDGFRIDTMKHVDDAFWQKFSPHVLDYAKAQGIPNFFMFGEVADGTRPLTSHYTTHNDVQAVLDFPFQEAARNFAGKSAATNGLRDFFRDDDYYTDADSNVYQLPTFLGNHDAGHIGMFLRDDNAGAPESELLARDKLAHSLMYLSRGNPVVYFGDEQGFTGAGNDQAARQDMFPSQDPDYDNEGDDAGKNDNIGSDETPMDDNYDVDHPLYQEIAALATLTKDHPALRDGAQQHRFSSAETGIYAFSRLGRDEQREYVVALNNSELPKAASIPTAMASGRFDRLYGTGANVLTSDADRNLEVVVPALSAVVYEAAARVPASDEAPSVAVVDPAHDAQGRDRMEVRADLGGDSFYEVTFYARVGDGAWESIGTDDNAPYRVFHDISDVEPGTAVHYKAVVLDNAGHSRESAERRARVAKPSVTVAVKPSSIGGPTEVKATTVPERSSYAVTFQRRIGDGDWTDIGTDDSSPAYIVYDTPPAVPSGTTISYRAILDYGSGTVTSPEPKPFTTAIVHYNRTAADYDDWGLHLFGDAIAPGVGTDWTAPRAPDDTDAYGVLWRIPIQDESKPVKFIVHKPSGDTVPDNREPGGDRAFTPATNHEIWLKENDATVYFSQPG
jgi:alpha-amylase